MKCEGRLAHGQTERAPIGIHAEYNLLVVTPCSLAEIYRLSEKYTVSIIRTDSTLKM